MDNFISSVLFFYKMILNILFVFLGSGFGGVCRWGLGNLLNTNHPYGTFAANILGCFLIGCFSRIIPADSQLKLLFITGFCGGFTTFSTFINENFLLLRGSQLLLAFAYILLSILFGLIAAWLGYNIR